MGPHVIAVDTEKNAISNLYFDRNGVRTADDFAVYLCYRDEMGSLGIIQILPFPVLKGSAANIKKRPPAEYHLEERHNLLFIAVMIWSDRIMTAHFSLYTRLNPSIHSFDNECNYSGLGAE